MTKQIEECLKRIKPLFPSAFVNMNLELIVERKNNIYFRLDNIETELEFKRKMIEYVSRSCIKGVPIGLQRKHLYAVNEFLGTDFNFEQMEAIYTEFGNGSNETKCTDFIVSGFDLNLLKYYSPKE